MIRFLNSQPLLLPAFALALSILLVDFANYLSCFLAVCLIIALALAKAVSARSLWLTIAATVAGLAIHSLELQQMRQLESLAEQEVTLLAVVENEPRRTKNFRQEIIVNVRQSSINDLTGAS